jgi:hypothetical protein
MQQTKEIRTKKCDRRRKKKKRHQQQVPDKVRPEKGGKSRAEKVYGQVRRR